MSALGVSAGDSNAPKALDKHAQALDKLFDKPIMQGGGVTLQTLEVGFSILAAMRLCKYLPSLSIDGWLPV